MIFHKGTTSTTRQNIILSFFSGGKISVFQYYISKAYCMMYGHFFISIKLGWTCDVVAGLCRFQSERKCSSDWNRTFFPVVASHSCTATKRAHAQEHTTGLFTTMTTTNKNGCVFVFYSANSRSLLSLTLGGLTLDILRK